MMAVVGIQLRHSGYADLRPGEYVAVEEPNAVESEKPSKKSIRQAISDSLETIKSKIPSLRSPSGPTAKQVSEPTAPEPPEVPVVTASQQRAIAPSTAALTVPSTPDVVAPAASKKKQLILPEPTIVDLSELEAPDVAQLRGLIETEDDEPESMFDDE